MADTVITVRASCISCAEHDGNLRLNAISNDGRMPIVVSVVGTAPL